MSKSTKSSNWGAKRGVGVAGEVLAGMRATNYQFINFDTSEKFTFMLGDFGVGLGAGVGGGNPKDGLRILVLSVRRLFKWKWLLGIPSSPGSYKKIAANHPFSADDLDLSKGLEIAAGISVGLGVSFTSISATPFFVPKPVSGAVVNNDWFTAQPVMGPDAGLAASVAFQPFGIWLLVD